MNGKLTIHMEVLDPTGDDSEDVRNKHSRWVCMYRRYWVTYDESKTFARQFIAANIPDNRREDLKIVWQPDPVRFDPEVLMTTRL